jgi:DNA-binding winged helix-turn-helix (wHTH) protein/tetratricopeptide (TPR) repeat protein
MGNNSETPNSNELYQFGAFTLDPKERLLNRDGSPVPLPPRVFDTLLFLVANAGSLVRKSELMDRVWPGARVEEVNLAHNISDLRRVLGTDAIQTVPKHGYRFVEAVAKIPRRISEPVGRETVPLPAPPLAPRDRSHRAIALVAIAVVAALAVFTVPKRAVKDNQEILAQLETNPAAVQLYLKGRYFFGRRTTHDFERAAEMYRDAIKIDPHYARAYASLAEALVFDRKPRGEAQAALDQALAIDPNLADAHALLGLNAMNLEADWKKTETELRHAIQLNPNLVEAHQWYGDFLGYMGRFPESAEQINAAIALDPLSAILWSDKCEMLILASQFGEAIRACNYVLEMHPDYFIAHYQLVQAYILNDQPQEALATAEKALLEDDRPLSEARLAQAYAAAGRRGDSLALLQKMEARGDAGVAPAEVAMCYTLLGDREMALEWLERSRASGTELIGLKMNPMLVPLRGEPRFQALVDGLHLSELPSRDFVKAVQDRR